MKNSIKALLIIFGLSTWKQVTDFLTSLYFWVCGISFLPFILSTMIKGEIPFVLQVGRIIFLTTMTGIALTVIFMLWYYAILDFIGYIKKKIIEYKEVKLELEKEVSDNGK